MSTASTSCYCYRCSRFIRVFAAADGSPLVCPECNSGFVEEVAADSSVIGTNNYTSGANLRRRRRNNNNNNNGGVVGGGGRVERPGFNPVIVVRGAEEANEEGRGFELFYDDGTGSGLQPLPSNMSEFLLGSGFNRLLNQLSQMNLNAIVRDIAQPEAKSAVDSLPTMELSRSHVADESHCAVCKDLFEFGSKVKEMPCKHIYHVDCILPWLAQRNSCPVCRHELPVESPPANGSSDDDNTALTIWRLPGGGFAVGRVSGGRRASGGADRELPVVYEEMENGDSAPRRVSWSRRNRGGGGGVRRFVNGLFSCFSGDGRAVVSRSSRQGRLTPIREDGRVRPSNSTGPPPPRNWSMEVNNGVVTWG